jgi:hypothetical protein
MRRVTWLFLSSIVLAATIGADGPVQVRKRPVLRSEADAKAKAKVKAEDAGKSPPAAQERPGPPASPDQRATSLFRSGQNLEKAGKTPGAIGLYRDVMIRYPESPEATESAARIKILGGKLPAPSEINPAPPAEAAKFSRPPKPRYASQGANRAALNQALGGMIGGAMSGPAPNGNYRNKGAYSP